MSSECEWLEWNTCVQTFEEGKIPFINFNFYDQIHYHALAALLHSRIAQNSQSILATEAKFLKLLGLAE